MRWRKTDKYEKLPLQFFPGIKKSPTDGRDFKAMRMTPSKLAPEVDLTKFCPAIKQQGYIGSCGSHAAATGVELLRNMRGEPFSMELSERFHYYVVRSKDYMNSLPQDSGQFLRDGVKVLNQVGIAPEILCPYIVSKYNEKPSGLAYAFASLFKVKSYRRCWSTSDIMSELSRSRPVIFGMGVTDSFMKHRGSSVIEEQTGVNKGGHAMLAIGHNVDEKWIKLCNSWGTGWGDRGFGKVSTSCLRKAFIEAWSVEV